MNDIAASEGGALTVLQSFYRYVRQFDHSHDWTFLTGSRVLEDCDRIHTVVQSQVKRSWARRLAFDFVLGRRVIKSFKPDVVLSLQNTYTYGVGVPQVVYVHQSLPFQRTHRFSLLRGDERLMAVYQHAIGRIIRRSIRSADHVIVQAEWMRGAIVDQVGIPHDRVECVPPALEDLGEYVFDESSNVGEFFYPTADFTYKNNDCTFAAARLLRERGILEFKMVLTLDGNDAGPNVELIGRVAREQVLERLTSSALVFPSFIETYGLPLAEAKSIGAIVLAADLPYAREVLDGYPNAYFFDPDSASQLAALMAEVIEGRIKRQPIDRSRDPREPGRHGKDGEDWAKVVERLEALVTERRNR